MREGGQRRHYSVLLRVVSDAAGFVHILRKQSQVSTSSHLGVMLLRLLAILKSVCAESVKEKRPVKGALGGGLW